MVGDTGETEIYRHPRVKHLTGKRETLNPLLKVVERRTSGTTDPLASPLSLKR